VYPIMHQKPLPQQTVNGPRTGRWSFPPSLPLPYSHACPSPQAISQSKPTISKLHFPPSQTLTLTLNSNSHFCFIIHLSFPFYPFASHDLIFFLKLPIDFNAWTNNVVLTTDHNKFYLLFFFCIVLYVFEEGI